MNKVLIIGGAGFIGLHLAKELLKNDNKVTLADNFSRASEDNELKKVSRHKNVELLKIDILDIKSTDIFDNNFDYIYHFAAIIGVENVLKNPNQVLMGNMQMLNNAIVIAKRQKNLKRFIFTSTSEVYAGTLKYFEMKIPTPEDTPLTVLDLEHSRTSYMLSKIYGEAVLHQSKLNYLIVRPHNIYGPRMGMSHIIPQQLFKSYFAKNDEIIDVFSPDHRRTFCYVSDAVKMIYELAINEKTNKATFNIGNQDPEFSIEEVVNIIFDVTGNKPKVNPVNIENESPIRRCPLMDKTYSYIGKRNTIELQKGIEMTFNWYKENIFESYDSISIKEVK